MYLYTLSDWLAFIGTINGQEIELGLSRVKIVASRLKLLSPSCCVIIVGGTNGKGSCVATLEAIYRAAGYQVGAFTTPILFKHNEEVRINTEFADDAAFCEAFAQIEKVRGDVKLTPFEFHTLAALYIFNQQPLDVMILEVGLGGRLDAVNIMDADLCIVSSIALDHMEWLGNTREAIGFEKAGIFRSSKPAVCGDPNPPASLIKHAEAIQANLLIQGKDFRYAEQEQTWIWSSQEMHYEQLPFNGLAIQNMSTVLMAVTMLQKQLPVTRTQIDTGLSTVKMTGRIQVIPGKVTEILDVAHNPAAVAHLAAFLQKHPVTGKTYAVFSMLADKDIQQSLLEIKNYIQHWCVAPLQNVNRGASATRLQTEFATAEITNVTFLANLADAYTYAKQHAQSGDRIIIFGSFHTVASVALLSSI